ncbi:hypothetical protein OIU78_000238 [Salix suchowensis]|nr:hypothetical protein OIU78_000238 [Salix suchowensis]
MGNLGETLLSFGFEGTGKFSSAGNFESVGEKFVRLEIQSLCFVELESKPLAFIGFSENGKWLGFAKGLMLAQGVLKWSILQQNSYNRSQLYFLMFYLKNVVVHLQYSVEDGLAPEQVYKPWASALDDGNEIMGPSSSDISDCEVVMVAGLPASDSLHFFYQSNQCFQNACTHKLKPFSNFCKIAVVAFPKPEDLEFRVDKRFKEMGMEVPADATNNMIGFTFLGLPCGTPCFPLPPSPAPSPRSPY